jgi:hypothetical protein
MSDMKEEKGRKRTQLGGREDEQQDSIVYRREKSKKMKKGK